MDILRIEVLLVFGGFRVVKYTITPEGKKRKKISGTVKSEHEAGEIVKEYLAEEDY